MSTASYPRPWLRNPLQLLEENFRRPAGRFGRLLGHVMALQHKSLTRWTIDLMKVQPADRVLDVGCGGGMAVKLLAQSATEGFVAGLDYSQDMVAQAARRNAKAIARGQVHIVHGNAMALPYEDQTFDKVCGIETFYFWPDPLRGLEQAYRVLRPGGQLTITLEMSKETANQSSRLRKFFTQRYAARAARIGQRICSGHQLVAMLKQAGFRHALYTSEPNRSLGWLCAQGAK
jgi:ubiquinone/menaquinone biosynthesis C-methylase UbiE